jgi:hypothetical protein
MVGHTNISWLWIELDGVKLGEKAVFCGLEYGESRRQFLTSDVAGKSRPPATHSFASHANHEELKTPQVQRPTLQTSEAHRAPRT